MESLAKWKEVCSDRPLCNEADTSSFGMLEALPDHLLILCLGGLSRYQLARLQCVCHRFRNLLTPEILLEHRRREGLLEPWLCVVGGVHIGKQEEVAEMFDTRAQRWCSMPAFPSSTFFNFACAVLKSRLYMVGGFASLSSMSPSVSVYDFSTNTWHKVAAMQQTREAFACGVVNGQIYVAGGLCRQPLHASNPRINTAEVYIPELNIWRSIANMKEGRSCCASAVVGDKLFVIGGYGTESILRTVEMYDPVIDNWETRCEMFGTWIIAGCAAIGHYIYVVGSNMLDMDSQELAVYDTHKDVWELQGSIPLSSLVIGLKCSLWGCAVAAIEGMLYVVGGASSYDGGGLNLCLMYDPETAIWRTLQSMNSRRHGCAAAVISF